MTMTMTVEEMKAMVGTEFTYVFTSEDAIPAVVAAFDPDIGFTCLATELVSRGGYDYSKRADETGNICLIGVGAKMPDFIPEVTRRLKEIKETGMYQVKADYIGNPSCSF